MVLTPASRFGAYEILTAIGAGGMGEVYRARDTKLGRDVAIKVLPSELAIDVDRLARFEREAKTLATLNHPNVAQIYGLEESNGTTALVMELVDGESLDKRIARGRIPVDEALVIAAQIAEALEAAHEQGIVHRDLKPANIAVTRDGRVKVLDFGLAKAIEPAPGSSSDVSMRPTITTPAMTHAGTILGTAAYMSPEQAKGHVVDKRADIWAFGVVLFEMLTGQHAFKGDSVAETLASVLKDAPHFAAMPDSTPPQLRALIQRCVERDVKRRLRDIGEARIEIARLRAGVPEAATTSATVPVAAAVGWRALPWAITSALAAALVATLIILANRPQADAPLRRFTLALPSRSAPNWSDLNAAISPDGAHLAYNCRDGNTVSLCLRSLDSLTIQRITDARDASDWFFSPDSQWIGIADNVGLSKVSVRGGQPQTIYRWPGTDPAPEDFSWGPDDEILFGGASGIQRIAASGGSPRAVTRIDSKGEIAAHRFPSHMPGGRTALITIVRTDSTETAGLVDLRDGSIRDLGIRGRGFTYVAPGWLVFLQATTILAVPFDPAHPVRAATPVAVIENVASVPIVARDGTLVYLPTRGDSNARLVWVDRDGRATAIGSERLDYSHVSLAPDGRRALLELDDRWTDLIDLESGTRKRLAEGSYPIWSSDGQRVTVQARGGLQSVSAEGNAPPEVLVAHEPFAVPTSWNARTGDLAFYDDRTSEIRVRAPDGTTRRFLGPPGRKRSGRFSPDGKWMAFVSDETGEYQVYVTAYPGPGAIVPVSTKGGLSPIWSADGRELFFRLGTKMLVARVSTGSALAFSVPVELFDGLYTLDLHGHQREDVMSDGRRFLMVENSDDFPIVIVQNWPVELRRVVPVP